MEQKAYRKNYLRAIWQEQENHLVSSGNRRIIARAIQDAEALPFPGPTGVQDKRVLIGILKQAYQMDDENHKGEHLMDPILHPVAVSLRELGEYASVTDNRTINHSLQRLERDPDIQLLAVGEVIKGAGKRFGRGKQYYYLFGLIQGLCRKIVRYELDDSSPLSRQSLDTQELWTSNYLGRTAGEVYPILNENPITEAELCRRTLKSRKAVRNGLIKLAEAKLAEKTPKGWIRGSLTAEEVARAKGCAEQGNKRRKRHEADRS